MIFTSPTTFLLLLLSISITTITAQCPNSCSFHGSCDIHSRCTCFDGFEGSDCSIRICPSDISFDGFSTADDTAHPMAVCSARGTCDVETGTCICMEGFSGKACQKTGCNNDCSRNGRCMSYKDMASVTMNSLSQRFEYSTVWDAEKIFGCVCDEGFTGYDCSLKSCPTGDDPLTTGQVNEIQLMKCVADNTDGAAGTFALYFKGKATSTIRAGALKEELKAALESIPGVGTVAVSYSSGLYACDLTSPNIITIEFQSAYGSLPPIVPFTDLLLPLGSSITMYSKGEIASDRVGNSFTSVTGTKEESVCAGRGTCDYSTGSCTCYDDNGDTYTSSDGNGNPGVRGDCGAKYTEILNCPGEVSCSGHGACQGAPTYKCLCSTGWFGGNCDQRYCPVGPSWFDYPAANDVGHKELTPCSDMGTCDHSVGLCICRPGHYGAACQFMACGGGFVNACSGHGQCNSLRQLSWISDNNGDATDYVYGTDPNNAHTWDADRIFGCDCDDGWEGYDCSLKSCPYGWDSALYEQVHESQLLLCKASPLNDNGWFKLRFRQETTAAISWDATAAQLATALEALDSINGVTVEFIDTRTTAKENTIGICQSWDHATTHAESNVVKISFASPHGDLPAIQVAEVYPTGTSSPATSVTIAQDGATITGYESGVTKLHSSVKGTTESEVCSNRGNCDYQLGSCLCNFQFSSSDGKGGAGNFWDCGHRQDKRSQNTFENTDSAAF